MRPTPAAAFLLVFAVIISGCRDEPAPQGKSSSLPPSTQTPADPKAVPTAVEVTDKMRSELTPFMALIRNGDLGAARVRLLKHINQHPDDGQAVFLFGLTYHREKKYAQATPHFERALKLEPNYIVAHYFYGWALHGLGELEQSRAQFLEYIKHRPNEPDSNFALGLIALEMSELDQAQARFEQAIKSFQADFDEVVKNADNKPPAMVEELKRKNAAGLAKSHARLSEVFEQREDFQAAKQHLQTAVKFFPDAYEALYKLYRIHVRLGENDEAERVHKEYIAAKERVRPGTSFGEEQ